MRSKLYNWVLSILAIFAALFPVWWGVFSSPSPSLSQDAPNVSWRINANFVGHTSRFDPHSVDVHLSNSGCSLEERDRCCHARVLVDYAPRPSDESGLCSELLAESNFHVTSESLARFRRDHLDDIYLQFFGSNPESREVSISFSSH